MLHKCQCYYKQTKWKWLRIKRGKLALLTLKIVIEDFKIGITTHGQKKIFEQFYRVEITNKNKFTGFGIGSFVASQIVQEHNGTIAVQSMPGKGSVFSFSLPFEHLLKV